MSFGFFTARDFKINNPAALGEGCGKCRLYKGRVSPRIKPFGEMRKGIMLLGEGPGYNEDQQGIPFVGDSGKFLTDHLSKLGIDMDQDCVRLNAVQCRPTKVEDGKIKNRTPTEVEVEHCRGRVWQAIEQYKPKLIISLGASSVDSLLGHRWNEVGDDGKVTGLGSIYRWHSWQIPDRDTKCWICPTYHPAFVLRELNERGENNALEGIFAGDLKRAVAILGQPVPTWENERDSVEIITDDDHGVHRIEQIARGAAFIVIDYETTGLKPQNNGHHIVYIGIAVDENTAIVFPTRGMKRTMRAYRELVQETTILKGAHNMQFEDMWTRERLGVQVEGWRICTMQTAHVLDQRKGVSGLKFQSYVQTGLVDYSSHVAKYLTATDADVEAYGDNAFNRIYDAPPKEVMIYCGTDCLSTYRIAMIQAKQLGIQL